MNAISPLRNPRFPGGQCTRIDAPGLWEIFIKLRSGKLTVDSGDPPAFFKSQLQENAVSILGITLEHVAGTLKLPMVHKDPFDRLIIAQALHEALPVLSSDPVFAEYGVKNLF